ncbi:HNH endonuclease [Halobacteria archaeon AArc-m2/3/4]|uniref:HNH endonuclease n=1 Tax=Natronoglomus mannanivorans TaxID=2979990 RepID=A0ABT2QA82_9EURY|nr:HNH endonuclease [Halobacteria archaeon AArc-m2/3/4]
MSTDEYPHPTGKPPEDRTHTEERFWEKVDISAPDECWEWTSAPFETGYGAFELGGAKRAHRIAYRLTYGSIPDDLQINHMCDNRICVNPAHLYAGTQQENQQDVIRRKRRDDALTPAEVREIRDRYANEDIYQETLADEFGTTQSVISRVVRGDAYEYIE